MTKTTAFISKHREILVMLIVGCTATIYIEWAMGWL